MATHCQEARSNQVAFTPPGLEYGKTTRLRLEDCRRVRRHQARRFEMAKQRRAVLFGRRFAGLAQLDVGNPVPGQLSAPVPPVARQGPGSDEAAQGAEFR